MQGKILFLIIFISAILALLTTLLPETGFDALWYHLTIPKLYLENGEVYHIPGGLLYYSEMPRLVEFLYLPLLKWWGSQGAHLLDFLSGIGSAVVIYLLSKKWLAKNYALLAVAIFYVTPLVSWTSGSAYVDLPRTFWEILTVYYLFERKILLAGLIFGLAISTKTLALGSYLPLLAVIYFLKYSRDDILRFLSISAAVGLPWFLSALLNTGHFLYPIGAGILDSQHNLPILQPGVFWNFFGDVWKLFMYPEDVISPVFVLLIPFIVLFFRKMPRELRILASYSLLSYIVWWLIPRTGGGRFILPYLPVWAIVGSAAIFFQKDILVKNLLITVVVAISLFNLGYRAVALKKALPFFLGRESETGYLCQNIDFSLSTFVDCDGFVRANITSEDTLLVVGVHNLYYMDVPFVHDSWYRGQNITKLLLQNSSLSQIPEILKGYQWRLIYTNNLTRVKIYQQGDSLASAQL